MSQLSSSVAATNQQKKSCAGCGKEEGAGLILKICSGCHSVSYCGSACQRAGWPGHKKVCKEIQTASIKGGSGVGSPLTAPLSPSVERHQEAVYDACARGHHEELQIVLRQPGLDINWVDPDNRSTAVHAAAQNGHDKCLSAIIRHGGADLSKGDKFGWAPIHTACGNGRIACLLILLDHDIDPNVRMADASTPMMLCCIGGHVKCLALLLDRGADPDLACGEGRTPAHAACQASHLKCLQLLIARGANFNAVNQNGTPLDYARRYGHANCVELLIENNAVGEYCVEDLPTLSEADKVRLLVVHECLFALTCYIIS